jgi:hypothetical protein
VNPKDFTNNTVHPWIDPHADNIIEEMDAAVLDRCADKIYSMFLKTTLDRRV